MNIKERVYINHYSDELITGMLTQQVYRKIKKYKSFFTENDTEVVTGICKIKLPSVNGVEKQRTSVYVRAMKDDFQYGYYGPESWTNCWNIVTSKNEEGITVVFDEKLFRRILSPHQIQKSDVTATLPTEDLSIFNQLFQSYQETKQ